MNTLHYLMVLREPPLRITAKFATSLPVEGVRVYFPVYSEVEQYAHTHWITRADSELFEWFAPSSENWIFDLTLLRETFFSNVGPPYRMIPEEFRAWPSWLRGKVYMPASFEVPREGTGVPRLAFYFTARSVANSRTPQTAHPITHVYLAGAIVNTSHYQNYGNSVVVGSNSSVSHTNISQAQEGQAHQPAIDLEQLANELATLRREMRTLAGSTNDLEHDRTIAKVAEAEASSRLGNFETTKSHLKAAGNWALEIASKIGTSVAEKAIAAALDLP